MRGAAWMSSCCAGAGFHATLQYLRGVDSDEARDAISYILECDDAGDFAGHDAPGSRLEGVIPEYRRYYGVAEPS